MTDNKLQNEYLKASMDVLVAPDKERAAKAFSKVKAEAKKNPSNKKLNSYVDKLEGLS